MDERVLNKRRDTLLGSCLLRALMLSTKCVFLVKRPDYAQLLPNGPQRILRGDI